MKEIEILRKELILFFKDWGVDVSFLEKRNNGILFLIGLRECFSFFTKDGIFTLYLVEKKDSIEGLCFNYDISHVAGKSLTPDVAFIRRKSILQILDLQNKLIILDNCSSTGEEFEADTLVLKSEIPKFQLWMETNFK